MSLLTHNRSLRRRGLTTSRQWACGDVPRPNSGQLLKAM